jgi:type II secretory pathway pseudopilin PulG
MSRRSSSATSRRAESSRPTERGVTLVSLVATITIMAIGMYVAMPSWIYVLRRDREEQLIYQGYQIVKAIRAFQTRGGLPTSLKQMVEAKVLRPADAAGDPMVTTKDGKLGKWCLVSPDQIPPACLPAAQAPPDMPTTTCPDRENVGFIGVMSRGQGESYGIFNNKNHYDQWCFAATDLIPPNIEDLAEFRETLMVSDRPPKFKGGGDKVDQRKKTSGKSGTGSGGGVLAEPGPFN